MNRNGNYVSLSILYCSFVFGCIAQKWGDQVNFISQWQCMTSASDYDCQSSDAMLRVGYFTSMFFLVSAFVSYYYPQWHRSVNMFFLVSTRI